MSDHKPIYCDIPACPGIVDATAQQRISELESKLKQRALDYLTLDTQATEALARAEKAEALAEQYRKDAERWRELDQGDGTCPLYPGGYLMLAVHYPNGEHPTHEVADYNTAIDNAIQKESGNA